MFCLKKKSNINIPSETLIANSLEIRTSGGDGIQVELFQILKDNVITVLHSTCQQIWKTQQWTQDCKRSVFILIIKKGNAKQCSNSHTIALVSHPSKEMLKILQARFQQYVNQELPDVQAEFRRGRGTRDLIANICWIIDKAREFQKNIYFCFIDYAKAFDSVKVKENPKNTGVGSLSLLQEIFLTQELNQVSCIAGRFFTN